MPLARTCLFVLIVLCLSACRQEPQAEGATAGAVIEQGRVLERALSILAWPGYVERDASDPNRNWVGGFEKRTGCQVQVRTAESSDEMVALMQRGEFDLVTASGDASLQLVAAGLVQAIDVGRIPSFTRIDPRLRDAPWHSVDGVHYGVPYQWGPNVLMYRTDVFKTAPDSWSVVFEPQDFPDGKPNAGRVQAFDGPIYLADAALYLMHARPELRIRDPYELNLQQYEAVLALLRGQKALVHRYWHDYEVQMSDFRREGVAASSSWPLQANQLRREGAPVAATIPREGATGWADTTMLHSRARHPNCAYAWMEWSLGNEVQGEVAASFGSLPAVPAACRENPLLGAEGCRANGIEYFDRLHFWRLPTAACADPAGCVPYSRWVADYLALRGE